MNKIKVGVSQSFEHLQQIRIIYIACTKRNKWLSNIKKFMYSRSLIRSGKNILQELLSLELMPMMTIY